MAGLLWFQSTDECKQYFETSAITRMWLENISHFSCWILTNNTNRVNCIYSYLKKVAKFKITINGNRDTGFSPIQFHVALGQILHLNGVPGTRLVASDKGNTLECNGCMLSRRCQTCISKEQNLDSALISPSEQVSWLKF